MPVMWDDEQQRFVVFNPVHCDTDMYDTSCDAPGCTGFECTECGAGCDIERDPEMGLCAKRIARESPEDAAARRARERTAWGLSPEPAGPLEEGN